MTSQARPPNDLAFDADDSDDDDDSVDPSSAAATDAVASGDEFGLELELDPDSAEALGVRILPSDPHARVVVLGSTDESYEMVAIEPDESGYDLIAGEIAEDRAAGAFEVRRPASAAPDALAWIIAWDSGSASDVAAADDWIESVRSRHNVITLAGLEGPIQQLVDPVTGLTKVLIVSDDTALLIADTGGGAEVVDYYLAALG